MPSASMGVPSVNGVMLDTTPSFFCTKWHERRIGILVQLIIDVAVDTVTGAIILMRWRSLVRHAKVRDLSVEMANLLLEGGNLLLGSGGGGLLLSELSMTRF